MNKKILLTLSMMLTLGSVCAYAAGVDKLQPLSDSRQNRQDQNSTGTSIELDKNTVYYPDANIDSAVAKYKAGNYSGCLQELFSLVKKEPLNALAYYYMAMAYSHVDMVDDAVAAYEKVIALNPNEYLVDYATKGRDCLTDGPACKPVEEEPAEELDELDIFINAPYGNGFSPELNQQMKEKELVNIKETINTKENLEEKDIQRIKDFDKKKLNSAEVTDKIAQVSDQEILNAIKTLKDAGLNLTVQKENPYEEMMRYQDPSMAEISMLLGGNSNNNTNSMMNMLPMLMSQAQKGENIDPRLMQAMIMNSMMSDFTFSNDNNQY